MSIKNKLLIGLAFVVVIAATAGLTTLATGSYGSQTDPLITQSYIDQVVIPSIMSQFDAKLQAKSDELTSEFSAQLDAVDIPSSTQPDETEAFAVVSLKKDQTLTCAVGTEIMPRIGTVKSAGPDNPRLVDETTGKAVAEAGVTLEKNHMYMVTIKNNGIKASTDAKVLVRGDYTIS